MVVIDEEKENLERTKHGIYRLITSLLAESIKNKKSKSFYSPVIKVSYKSLALVLKRLSRNSKSQQKEAHTGLYNQS